MTSEGTCACASFSVMREGAGSSYSELMRREAEGMGMLAEAEEGERGEADGDGRKIAEEAEDAERAGRAVAARSF